MSAGQASTPLVREAPRIETERLVLRHYHKEDFRPHHAIVGDPEVMRHFSGPIGAEECWRRIAASAGQWSLLGFGGWAVCRKDGGDLIGTVGLFNAWRDFEPVFGEEPEMGWIFAKEVHGHGMAGETCHAVLGWAEKALEPTAIWAIIAPENQPSFRLAERLGFERLEDTVYNGEPTAVLRRPAWA